MGAACSCFSENDRRISLDELPLLAPITQIRQSKVNRMKLLVSEDHESTEAHFDPNHTLINFLDTRLAIWNPSTNETHRLELPENVNIGRNAAWCYTFDEKLLITGGQLHGQTLMDTWSVCLTTFEFSVK
jgi:hypothetical protein